MDLGLTGEWQVFPATGLVAVGLAVAAFTVWRTSRRRPATTTVMRAVGAFRGTMIVFALASTGAAWLGGWPILAAIALAVGFEETFETSIVLGALRRESEAEAAAAQPEPASIA